MTTIFTNLRTVAVWTLAIAAVVLGPSCRSESRERVRPSLRSSPTGGLIVHTYPGAQLHGAFSVWGAGRIRNMDLHALFREADSDARSFRVMPQSHLTVTRPAYHGWYDSHAIGYQAMVDRPGEWSFSINVMASRGRGSGVLTVRAKAGESALGDVVFCESLLSLSVIEDGSGQILFPLINRYDARFHYVDDLRLVEELSPTLVVLQLRVFESPAYESIEDTKRILDAFIERGASVVIMAGGFEASTARANTFLQRYGIRFLAQDELTDAGIDYSRTRIVNVNLADRPDVLTRRHAMGQIIGDGIGELRLVKPWPLVADDPDSVLIGNIWGSDSDVAFAAASAQRPTVMAIGVAGIGAFAQAYPYDNLRLLDNILNVALSTNTMARF